MRHSKESSCLARVPGRILHCVLALALVAPGVLPAHAANHPLSAVADASTLDYVVNVDFDFDSPPPQAGDSGLVVDREFIRSVIRQAAESVFTMTEGLHRFGNIYVYRNKRFATNVDIQIINVGGRASAHVAGLGIRNRSSRNFLAYQFASGPQANSAEKVGKVIAHELGHYTYGLFDEYVQPGRALDSLDQGSPSESDTPKPTLMNNQNLYKSLSTPADYADPNARQTAQSRVYATNPDGTGGSAWETLARTPEKDPVRERSIGRVFYEAFRGVDPAKLQLAQPVAGFDAKLNIIFVTEPIFRDVIMVDRNLSAERFATLISGAKAMLSQAAADTQYAIVASPAPTAGPVVGFTPTSIEGKAALAAALDGLQPAAAGLFDPLAALNQGLQLMQTVRQSGDTSTFHILTGVETNFPVEFVTAARNARVAANPLALIGATPDAREGRRALAKAQSVTGATVNLAQVAQQTGGVFNIAKDRETAAKDLIRGVKETHADLYAPIANDDSTALAAGAQFQSTFRVASASTDGDVDVEWTFDPTDAPKLQFSLTAPGGSVYTPASLPAGITFHDDAKQGVSGFLIKSNFAGRVGLWKTAVTASAAMREGVGVDVSGASVMRLTGDFEGGAVNSPAAPLLRATLGGEVQIKGAIVTANIYNTDGKTVLANLPLLDDGLGQDNRAGDGLYTLDLAGRLRAGEYLAVISAETNADSRTSSLGYLQAGDVAPELPVELMSRFAEASLVIEAGSPAYVVEFYNTTFDRFFMTSDISEGAAIDNGGAGPGWKRTGSSFKSGGNTAVCRFYGSLSPGPNSHFYTVDPLECASLKQIQATTPASQQRWNFESLDFQSTPPTNGNCPNNTTPIYRAYNNGFTRRIDSNHRITSDPDAIKEVVTRGWKNEGIVMCAPS